MLAEVHDGAESTVTTVEDVNAVISFHVDPSVMRLPTIAEVNMAVVAVTVVVEDVTVPVACGLSCWL
jgi:hypothetical protein